MSDNPKCGEACRAPVKCATCHRTKSPVGRSVAMEAANGYCGVDCPGYFEVPLAGHLFPSELIGAEQPPTEDDE